MSKHGSIAVLIAVYNRAQLFQKTLDSIVDDLSEITVIAVDDGSYPPICKDTLVFAGSLVLLKHESNQGLVAALNTGLRYILDSGFEYVARLDAGDLAVRKRFSIQREFLRKHPQYGLVGSRVKEIGSNEKFLVDASSAELKKRLHIRSEFAHPAVMLTAVAIKDVGFYDKKLNGVEDWDYWLRLSAKYEVKNLPEVLTELDGTPGSISRDKKYYIRIKRRLLKVRVLWRHFDPGCVEAYAGLFLALAVLGINIVVPPRIILARPKFS